MRHRDNQIVSGVMTIGIVDIFKAIEVKQQQRRLAAVAHGARQRLRQTLLDQRAVGQPGQHIMKRQVLRLRFAGAQLQHRLRQPQPQAPQAIHHHHAHQRG